MADNRDYQEVELQGTTWAVHLPVTLELLNDVKARAWIDQRLGEACIQLRGQLFYENLETIEYPADWWEALKVRWFPRWARQWWPVRVRRYEINAYYPSIKMPEHQGHVWVPRLEDREVQPDD